MDPGLTFWLIFAAILCLAPVAAYLLGFQRDPFNPLIIFGAMSYFLAVQPLLFHEAIALEVVDASDYSFYEAVVAFSVLSFYLGWYISKRRLRGKEAKILRPTFYDENRLLTQGIVLICIALTAYIFTYGDYTVTAYARDSTVLWVAGCVLVIQSMLISRRNVAIAIAALCVGLIPPVNQFLIYGQRGDTIRLGMLAIPIFMFLRRRPSKPLMICAGVGAVILLSTIALTRGIVEAGEASNRFTAIAQVIPKWFATTPTKLSFGEEYYEGTMALRNAREYNSWGYGTALFVTPLIHMLPHEFFPWKYDYFYFHQNYFRDVILSHYSLKLEWGAAPSGFADAFIEFWYFFPLLWGTLAFIIHRIYTKATTGANLRAQGILIAFLIATVYLVTQEIWWFTTNLAYVLVPMLVAYKIAEIKSNPDILPSNDDEFAGATEFPTAGAVEG